MKKNNNHGFAKKNIILAAVSLLLIVLSAVTATTSWIEDVSQVKFNSNDDSQQTPMHIGSKVLKSDVAIKSSPTTEVVNLEDYFMKSGDMHLSPCYGDGEKFYFPVEGGSAQYRTGTKDDANVNYLSATFRVQSHAEKTVYWFEKTNSATNYVTFKKGSAAQSDSVLQQCLRCSITVDGATNVYAFNSNGQFKTIESNAASTKTGRRMDQYTYYDESFDSSTKLPNTSTNNGYANQGGGNNLNGNTLFTVPAYSSNNKSTVKTVTVKLWLECKSSTVASNTSAANIASLNINLVSSWAKTRRIFVKDATVHQEGYDSAKWLSTYNGTLFFALKDDMNNKHWKMTRVGTGDYYYADIPAVYNNAEAVLFRCDSRWDNGTTKSYTANNVTVHCWNYWTTTFPDTFHSETYTVYSTDFATWEDASNVHCIYFVNSCFFSNVFDYMWDSNSVHGTGINDKVVKNANWAGLKMTTKMAKKTKSEGLDTYAFFYNSDYDRIIFNDGDVVAGANQEYQTQDLWLTSSEINKTFDMATLTWFNTNPTNTSVWDDSNHSVMPHYSASNTHLYSNMSTNGAWKKTRFAYGGALSGTSSTKMICKFYNKVSKPTNKIFFKKPSDWGTDIKAYFWSSSNTNMMTWPGSSMSADANNDNGYVITIPDGATKVKFNDNAGNHSTADLDVNDNTRGKVYDNGTWYEYTSSYEMKLCVNGTWYGAKEASNRQLYPDGNYVLKSDNDFDKNLYIKGLRCNTVYKFTFEWENGNPKISMVED